MKKTLLILLTMLIFSISFFPVQKASANVALKIVAGSTAEKVLVGIAEKAGTKFVTKTARQRALERWNYDLAWYYAKEDAEMVARLARMDSLSAELATVTPTPIPNMPGYSKVILSSAAFLTGADIIYEGYHAFKNAYDSNKFAEVMAENIEVGNYYNSYYNFVWSDNGGRPSEGYYQYTVKNAKTNSVKVTSSYMWQEAQHTKYMSVESMTATSATLASNIFGLAYSYGQKTEKKTFSVSNSDVDKTYGQLTEVFTPHATDVPAITYNNDIPTPVKEPGIGGDVAPGSVPNEVEIIIPDGDISQDPEILPNPINDPIGEPAPEPEPTDEPADAPPNSDWWKWLLNPLDTIIDLLKKILAGLLSLVEWFGDGVVGEPSNIQWDKLKMTAGVFTTKFPFSLPWDIQKALVAIFGGFNDSSSPPSWDYTMHVLGSEYKFRIGFPQLMVNWSPFIKGTLLITFDIGLVYAVRKLLGGAS